MQLAVIPLLPNSKLPAIKDWPNQYKMADGLSLQAKDIGIVTGPPSNLLVLDCDVKSGGIETLAKLEAEGVFNKEDFAHVITASGGYHFYFQYPTDGSKYGNKAGFMPGLDIRATNGFVKLYAELDEEFFKYIKPVPEWLLKLIKPSVKSQQALAAVEGAVTSGGRNHYLAQIAGKLQRSNLLTLEGLMAINERDCAPSLDEQEVETIFNSISRYAPDENPVVDMQSVVTGKSLILETKDFCNETLDYLDDKDLVKGQSTFVNGIDELLGGGKRLGEITAITAAGKAGKSALIHWLIHKWIKAGIKVGYASREMDPKREVTPNLLSLSFKENAWHATGKREIYKKEMNSWPIYYTKGFGYIAFEEFKAWVLELKQQGVLYFVLDHLLLSMANPEDFKEVSLFMRNIKAFVNEEQIHLDLVIQPKQINPGDRIGANSLRGGANIGQAINTLFTMERVQGATNVSRLTLEMGRSRLCKQGSIFLQYNHTTTEFSEVEPEEEPVETQGPTYRS
jgi:hypothetical protein